MSSREPLWYCHECHAEMRPLMVPDPHCASCNGTFVEKLENPADDPRAFRGEDFGDDEFGPAGFIFGLSNILNPQRRPGPSAGSNQTPGSGTGNGNNNDRSTGSGFTIRIDRTGNGPARTVITGGAPRGDTNAETGQAQIPLLSEFMQRGPQRGDRDTITGPLMLQYLLAMLSQGRNGNGGMPDLFVPGMLPPGAENGRWGDYVFNQEALDQIMTQLMENSAAHPVPATEEIIDRLPREVLTEGSSLLERDCAICKDQFSLNTEDPDEQVVVTLPCKHPFHQPCIVPWLKSSGTCPVCRHELVPQPRHGGSGNNAGGSNSNGPPGSNSPPGNSNNGDQNQNNPNGGGQPGLFGGLFNLMRAYGNDQNNNTRNQASNSSSHRHTNIPGGWEDVD